MADNAVHYVYPASRLDEVLHLINEHGECVVTVVGAEKREGGFFPVTNHTDPDHAGFLVFTRREGSRH
ncbi:hypothetical protein [Streptantibioticus cattleyicolor]|uniref:Uncharacterized protein n=1 Tax=Streptantibioticus cattleyicolor (strain ATCC 35852 / DSM 46488 / JCM 4925 / NBRC 14057 / NRRL 8057) TaxID=1003195 RepID=F8JKZ7_STREN|nr:hypothetical protein [Streptantibioticus cattleyicolor]AEW99644.1 hypothetical protein SCATT_p14510 [Streptantibioticus cattleyicolor NRRL 8057 = DSM 46488]CCB71319.1 protein of unknown function [Streptantibioticus cattleyicolor NRRL 8057 = DSM 46488]